MKFLKLFESFDIRMSGSVAFGAVNKPDDSGTKYEHSEKFSEEFVEHCKQYLYELSDLHEITISFQRAQPRFIYKASPTNNEYRYSMIIEIVGLDYRRGEYLGPRTQAEPRTPIDKQELFDATLGLESSLQEDGFKVFMCESYLPFQTTEDFVRVYKNRSIYSCTLIIFKNSGNGV